LNEAVTEDDVYQEFPANDQEAFIASGRPVFCTRSLAWYLENAQDPITIGNLRLDQGSSLFHEDSKGDLKIWQWPEAGRPLLEGMPGAPNKRATSVQDVAPILTHEMMCPLP
jgi:hypothetical protein